MNARSSPIVILKLEFVLVSSIGTCTTVELVTGVGVAVVVIILAVIHIPGVAHPEIAGIVVVVIVFVGVSDWIVIVILDILGVGFGWKLGFGVEAVAAFFLREKIGLLRLLGIGRDFVEESAIPCVGN
ncbi:Glycerol-3-phosphate dehydrogenase [NAD(+)] 2 [Striga asiatica]|uniref:Glycerol-3-phosphate dehydrogenase [NAD(+)] 2 n=1 Tax=Striga asiatica TaxID=4170 RepID=A0A5A7P372_STRAF|nr:Glycerol-3-phosphate dehydrogenase [NAD(+)] 2 [Striga asiatica]